MSQQTSTILVVIGVVVGFWLIQRYIIQNLFKWLIKRYTRQQNIFKKEIFEIIEKPIRRLFISIGLLLGCSYAFHISVTDYEPLFNIFKTLLLFYFFQGLYLITNYFGQHPEAMKNRFNLKGENVLFPFFARIVKVFIVIFGFVMIANGWGYDINGFVAGLGIGGLALALGAKDVLSHIFAGVAMAIDKPFAIGDLISTGTGPNKLEGFVEDMNFRSTRIRTLDKALVSVPNAVIANEYLYNWTRRKNRRVRFFIGFPHNTTDEKIKTFIEKAKDIITNHSGVEEDSATVAFDSYTPNSVDVLIQYVTNTSDFNDFMIIKEDINYKIRAMMQNEGLEIALPTQNLYISKNHKIKN